MMRDLRSTLQKLIADALAGDPAAAGFDVHYQPIVRLENRVTVAVEALARWSHPRVGEVCPRIFVEIAEQLGLVGVLDNFVLARACAGAEALEAAYGREVDVHVNVSAGRLSDASLDAVVAEALEWAPLRPGRLVLEITETAQIADPRAALRVAERIRARGVRLALDDFAAGFNWFRRLHDLPIDILKLDASITHVESDPQHAALFCKALLTLCRELDMRIVAEGVESEAQALALEQLGCDVGQGYLLGRPQSLAQLVESQRRAPQRMPAVA